MRQRRLLVDKILDAKDDHARGEISLAPSASLYARLFAALALRVAALLATHPRPLALVRTGLRYVRPFSAPTRAG